MKNVFMVLMVLSSTQAFASSKATYVYTVKEDQITSMMKEYTSLPDSDYKMKTTYFAGDTVVSTAEESGNFLGDKDFYDNYIFKNCGSELDIGKTQIENLTLDGQIYQACHVITPLKGERQDGTLAYSKVIHSWITNRAEFPILKGQLRSADDVTIEYEYVLKSLQ